MRLGDIINFGGRGSSFPVYPLLLNWLGVSETIFLCRIIWWQTSAEQWVIKTTDEIKAETGLSYKQQTAVRNRLSSLGIIKQEYLRLQHTLQFRVLSEALQMEIVKAEAPAKREDGEKPETGGAPAKREDGICQKGSSTYKGKDNKEKEGLFPSNLNTDKFKAVWERWKLHRKEIKHALTPSTVELQLKKLSKWGETKAIAVIENAIEKGWQGFYELPPNRSVSSTASSGYTSNDYNDSCIAPPRRQERSWKGQGNG